MRTFTLIFTLLCWMPPAGALAASLNPYDHLIPADAIFYLGYDNAKQPPVSFPNYDQAWNNWFDTMDDILEWRVIQSEWQAMKQKAGIDNLGSLFAGNAWCLAGYPLAEGINLPVSGLFVSTVNDPAQTDRVLSSLFEQACGLIPFLQNTKDEYHGYIINTLYGPMLIPGLSLSYTFQDSQIFITNNKSLLLNTLDHLDYDEDHLADAPLYQKAVSQLPPDRARTFFINTNLIAQSSDVLLKNLQAVKQLSGSKDLDNVLPILQQVFSILGAFESYASARITPPDGKEITTAYLNLNMQLENPALRSLFTRPAVPFAFEGYLPRNTGSVTSTNILGPNDIWMLAQMLLSQFPDGTNLLAQLRGWEDQTGISIEKDYLSWMGDEWCFAKMVMDLDALVPMNEAALLIRVKDTEKAAQALKKTLQILQDLNLPVLIETETYREGEISTFSLPMLISPGWCLHENTLIIASHASLIRRMLDVKAGEQRGVVRNRYYQQLQEFTRQEANKYTFQDNESEFYVYREAIRRVGSIPEFGAALAGGASNIPTFLMDRAAYLMSCFQVLKATVKQSTVTENQVVSRRVRLLQDLRIVPPADTILRYKLSFGANSLIADWAAECRKKGDTERAARLYALLAEFFPREGGYLTSLAGLYKSAGRLDEALAVYDRALAEMPETAFVIGREALIDDRDVNGILQRLNSYASQSGRIRKDAALFGIALAKRAGQDTQTAESLWDALNTQVGPSSPFVQAAQAERALSQGQSPSRLLEIPVTDTAPVIDGSRDELWDNAVEVNLTSSNGTETTPVPVRLRRDASSLYLLWKEDNPTENSADTRLRILLGPARDYVHFYEIGVRPAEDGALDVAPSQLVLDPYGMTLKHESPKPFQPIFDENAPEWLRMIQDALMSQTEESETGSAAELYGTQAQRTAADSEETEGYWEIKVPLAELKAETDPVQTLGLWNLILTRSRDGREVQWSLTETGKSEDPLYFPWIRMN
ncbi:MAG: DUF3352 domain-containing protein [bacterium]